MVQEWECVGFIPFWRYIVLNSLGDEDRKPYPNITSWYLSLVATDAVIGSKDFPKQSNKPFKAGKKDKADKGEKKKE